MCERLHEVLATCYCAKANPKGLPLSLTRACLSGLDINICIYIYIYILRIHQDRRRTL